jgi:GNAT superfamily N-acetyltransferase
VIAESEKFLVREAKLDDISGIIDICKAVYPESPAWNSAQLSSHQTVFPGGQLVVLEKRSGRLAGFAASLIVSWEDYDSTAPWRDFTERGYFTNHDPEFGKTLYGAEIIVHPEFQGVGVGKLLYRAREILVRRLKLLRVRAGARLPGYAECMQTHSIEEYVSDVVNEKIWDPTLSFQLRQQFHVLRIISGYLQHDPESQGFAALIEWINPDVATAEDYAHLKKSSFKKQSS